MKAELLVLKQPLELFDGRPRLLDASETSGDDRPHPVEQEHGTVGQNHPAIGGARQRRIHPIQ